MLNNDQIKDLFLSGRTIIVFMLNGKTIVHNIKHSSTQELQCNLNNCKKTRVIK